MFFSRKRYTAILLMGICLFLLLILGFVDRQQFCVHELTAQGCYDWQWQCAKCGRIFTESYDHERKVIVLIVENRTLRYANAVEYWRSFW